jgi:hypothetical protein
MRRCLGRLSIALFALALAPSAALAQATIAGIVRDASGAVLPGVIVEASSPALIEKVRSVVTDEGGQYRIVDLRPGTYNVTFALPGFSTLRREGIALTGSFTATINAEMRVAALEETITVTGAAPQVDVQSAGVQKVIDHEVLDTIPSGRNAFTFGVLIPGVIATTSAGAQIQDVGGNQGSVTLGLNIHGGRQVDQVYTQNGILTTAMATTGFVSRIQVNYSATQEITYDTSGFSAELATGGVRINIVPREGGNTFSGTLFGSFGNDKLQSRNFSQALKDRGLSTPDSVRRNYDINPGFGGPLRRDRLWFYTSGRFNGSSNYVADMFENKNANNPSLWTYVPDRSQKAFNETTYRGGDVRLTWQATPRHKIAGSWVQQNNCECPSSVSAATSPEAATRTEQPLQRKVEADWTFPMTNQLLFEAGGVHQKGVSDRGTWPGLNPEMISVVEQQGNLRYRAAATYRDNFNVSNHLRFAASYITGTHAVKVGVNQNWGHIPNTDWALQPVEYRFNAGVPNRITMRALPAFTDVSVHVNGGAFAQDVWTMNRLTLRYGVRLDFFNSGFPEIRLGPTLLTPLRNVTLAKQDDVVSFKDISPRFGAAYDLFGTQRTALKASLNRYVASMAGGSLLAEGPNPALRFVTSTTRAWTDTNGNFVPDCDLLNLASNGECRGVADTNFGSSIPGSTYDPDVAHGWGRRFYNWEFTLGMQHQVSRGVSLEAGYFRRAFGNFFVTDNRALTSADFDTFSITAPSDPRLPNGGGYVVAGLYDLKPEKFGIPTDDFVTRAKNFGDQIERWHGIDLSTSIRPGGGVLLQGGISTGRGLYDNCEIVAKIPELNSSTVITQYIHGGVTASSGAVWQPQSFCRVEEPFRTQAKFIGSYLVPKIDVQVATTLQSLPGREILAEYVAPNSVVAPSLRRNLSGGAANTTINIVQSGTLYGERLNQVDLRLGKIFRFGGARRVSVHLDIFNALNADTVLTMNNAFGTWQRPTSIMLARFAKISTQLDF